MSELGRLITAMVTPFDPDGAVNYDAARRLALALLDSGTGSLVVAGTTGEAPTLSRDEKLRLFREVKDAVGDRAAVIANTGTYDTAESIELTREASAIADAIMLVTPYYNRPSQEGMARHFEAIAAATPLPCILYNVPSRTSVNLTAETAIRLSRVSNIAGVKEASRDLTQIATIIEQAAEGFRVWSGADEDTLPIIAAGGYGTVGVVTHLVGRQVSDMIAAAVAGRPDEAARIHRRHLPLIAALFSYSSPAPLKYVLNQLGFPAGPPRLPLCEPDVERAERIMAEVARHQIDLPVAV